MRFSRYVFLWLYQPDENKTFFIPSSLINELYVNPSGIALICKMRGVKLPGFSLICFFFDLAATCSPTPSPVQYHRPLRS